MANSAFQSASDGKSALATAITGMGVSTSSTATFDTMVANIKKIDTGKKWATGTVVLADCTNYASYWLRANSTPTVKTSTSNPYKISFSVSFKPSIVLIYEIYNFSSSKKSFLPVIFYSSNNSVEYIMQEGYSGANGYYMCPISYGSYNPDTVISSSVVTFNVSIPNYSRNFTYIILE